MSCTTAQGCRLHVSEPFRLSEAACVKAVEAALGDQAIWTHSTTFGSTVHRFGVRLGSVSECVSMHTPAVCAKHVRSKALCDWNSNSGTHLTVVITRDEGSVVSITLLQCSGRVSTLSEPSLGLYTCTCSGSCKVSLVVGEVVACQTGDHLTVLYVHEVEKLRALVPSLRCMVSAVCVCVCSSWSERQQMCSLGPLRSCSGSPAASQPGFPKSLRLHTTCDANRCDMPGTTL